MLFNPQKEIEKALRDLNIWFRKANPNDQFKAVMLLRLFDLYGTADKIKETGDIAERRCLLNEFGRKQSVFEKGITILRRSREKKTRPEQGLRHAMS